MEFLKRIFSPTGSLKRLGFLEVLIYSYMLLMLGMFVWLILMMLIFGSFINLVGDHDAFVKALTEFERNRHITYSLYMFFLNILTPLFWCLLFFGFLWVELCGMLKRLVDLNLSRWLVLIPFLSIGIVMLYFYLGFDLRYVGKFCALVIIGFFMFLLFVPSQRDKISNN